MQSTKPTASSRTYSRDGIPFFVDPHTLPDDLRARLRQFYSTDQSATTVTPLQLLFGHIPLSISAGRMIPTHQSPTPSGLTSDSRSFGTRRPNSNTDALFVRFKTLSGLETMDGSGVVEGKSRLFIRSDNGSITDILSHRLQQYLSPNQVDRQFFDRTKIRERLQAFDQPLMQAQSEAGVQGKNLMWDGGFINDSLREPSMFNPGIDPWPGLFGIQDATQWEAGTAIGDALVMCRTTNECVGTVEDKPKFHHARMKAVHGLASATALPHGGSQMMRGFFIERSDSGIYSTSLDPFATNRRGPIGKAEAFVYIQATEQCYAYGTRYCIIHGHQGHQITYLAKPNLLLISDVIEYKAGSTNSFTAVAAITALCLPPAMNEQGKLPSEPIPSREDIGLRYDQDRSSTTPQPFVLPSASSQSSSDVDMAAETNARSHQHPASHVSLRSQTKSAPDQVIDKRISSPKSLKLRFNMASPDQPLSPDDWRNLALALDGARLDLVDIASIIGQTDAEQPDPSTPLNRKVRTMFPSPPHSDGSADTSSSDGSPLHCQKVTVNTAQPIYTPPSSADIECDVIDLEFISSGATGHAFRGYIPFSRRRVVLKIASPSAQQIIINEASVYQRLATANSTPSIAPYCFGLYRTYPSCALDTRILVTEDAGQGLNDRHDCWETLTEFDIIDLKQCVDMLHSQHIVHGDLQLRHLRISPYTFKLNLIDFSHSILDADEAALEREKDLVLELVG